MSKRELANAESRRCRKQAELDQAKTAAERNKLGQFATPPELAASIAALVRSLWKGRREKIAFLDPALGTGAFYSALRCVFPSESVASAAGVELDAEFTGAAREIWVDYPIEIIDGDFTLLEPPPAARRFNLILTNPPYVRHHHMAAEDKRRLQEIIERRLSIKVSGLAGLYVYFLLLSHGWMREGGRAAWLIPSEFMEVKYGEALKRYLTTHVSLIRVHRFSPDDAQFGDALVTSTVVVFEKRKPSAESLVRFSFGGTLERARKEEYVPLANLKPQDKWTGYPGDPSTRSTADVLVLADIFQIKRGLATGANKFFILPRAEAGERGIPREFLKPILPSPRSLAGSVVERDDDGYPRIENPLVLIDCSLGENEIRALYSRFWEYLELGRLRGVDAGYLPQHRSPWYSQESRPPPPFLCTYMGRKREEGNVFRFIWNKSDATAANVYLLMYPRPALRAALAEKPELYATILKVLQEIEPEEMRTEGRVYGGGLYKLEPKELGRVSAEEIAEAAAGLAIEKQRSFFPLAV